MFGLGKKTTLPTAEEALPGRDAVMPVPEGHFVNGHSLLPPFADGLEVVYVGLGCFWGAERLFWQIPGVAVTAVGYAGGITANPAYEEVCSGGTGHTEVVMIVYDPSSVDFQALLKVFWEAHDPTQGMRQGNDVGTQYRSCIYCTTQSQLDTAQTTRDAYQSGLAANGMGSITTEIRMAPKFYYAEPYHQQYLAKNPGGYCGLAGTGVCLDADDSKVATA